MMFDQPSDGPRVARKNPAAIRPAKTLWISSAEIDPLWRERLMRAADVVFASALLLVTLPLAVFVCLAIKLDSPGPVVIREPSRNRAGQPYSIFKFRTAASDSPSASGPIWSGQQLTTRIGDFLRYSRIDELPQLLNVLRGEMTLIGLPRRTRAFDC